jgi:hypothetical protein
VELIEHTATFVPQEVIKNINISIINDAAVEKEKSFTVEISTKQNNVNITHGNATITILNDDKG